VIVCHNGLHNGLQIQAYTKRVIIRCK